MSYILDALRRADAERERGSVPGLHAQPMASAALPALRGGTAARWWIALAVLAGLLAVLLTALLLRRPEPAQVLASDAAAPAAATSTATAAPPVAVPPAPAALPVEPAPQTARPARPAARPAAIPGNSASTAAVASAPAPPLRLDPQMAAATPRPATAAAPVVAETRIPELKDLPEDLRRQLPALTIGGASYSANAASRMLIINGQVFHEKDPIGPDHVLEQIALKSAVLRFRGTRYSIAY